MKFEVVRQHLGDKMYLPGDKREMSEDDAKHLVPHVLRKASVSKAAPAPKNKAEPAPTNKAEPAPTNKAK